MSKYNEIFVVDVEQNLIMIKSELSQHYFLKTCLNGNEALFVLSDFGPAVVLLGWYMPDMDGLAVLKAIKANEKTKNLFVIMMTGYMTAQDDLLVAFNCGVIDFIRKTFDMLELKRVNSVVRLFDAFKHEIEMKDRELATSAIRLVESSGFMNDLINQIETFINKIMDLSPVKIKIEHIRTQLSTKGSDIQWKQFHENFKNVYPVFSNNLFKKPPNLTPGEIKLCTLMKKA